MSPNDTIEVLPWWKQLLIARRMQLSGALIVVLISAMAISNGLTLRDSIQRRAAT